MSEARNHAGYEWRNWESSDGLTLAARDYAGRADRPAIVCLNGLTRNSRDYDQLAARLAGDWRVVAPDFRGRGKSEYAKDPMTYLPPTYAADTLAMLDALGIERFVAVGTSLGGIVTMLIAPQVSERLAGVVLNDVGPEIDPVGIGRIRGYVGKAQTYPTWLHAARALAEGQGHVYPGYGLDDWLAMAKRLFRLNSSGRIVLDYDLKIAEPFRVAGNETGGDLWPFFAAMADVPLLVVRGQLSDVLSEATVSRMLAEARRAEAVVVPDTGHAPTLNEPAASAAIDRLLAKAAEPANA